jgi:hypothetical protein
MGKVFAKKSILFGILPVAFIIAFEIILASLYGYNLLFRGS